MAFGLKLISCDRSNQKVVDEFMINLKMQTIEDNKNTLLAYNMLKPDIAMQRFKLKEIQNRTKIEIDNLQSEIAQLRKMESLQSNSEQSIIAKSKKRTSIPRLQFANINIEFPSPNRSEVSSSGYSPIQNEGFRQNVRTPMQPKTQDLRLRNNSHFQ